MIDQYVPRESGIELLRETPLVLLVGITGAGKNTVLNEMVKTGEFRDLITTITRELRYNDGVLEREGVDYYFINEERAQDLLETGQYLEVSLVHDRVYGVTEDEIRRARMAGKIAIADIDVQGVEKYKRLSPNVTAIFLVPPSYEEWRRRVSGRYTDETAFLEDWPNRRQSAIMELERALAAPYYHFVINDELPDAVDACIKISHNQDVFVRKDDEIKLVVRDLLDQIKTQE